MTSTDPNGKTAVYSYDPVNRLLSKTPDASLGEPLVTFTYTGTGKRAAMTDSNGTTSYTYDNQDRLKAKATPAGTLNYTYDVIGNVVSVASSNTNGVNVSYTHQLKRFRLTVPSMRL